MFENYKIEKVVSLTTNNITKEFLECLQSHSDYTPLGVDLKWIFELSTLELIHTELIEKNKLTIELEHEWSKLFALMMDNGCKLLSISED